MVAASHELSPIFAIGVTVTQLAVGTGVITAAAGILATAGTYFNDKRKNTHAIPHGVPRQGPPSPIP